MLECMHRSYRPVTILLILSLYKYYYVLVPYNKCSITIAF
jgi:hypothetical protein